MHERRRIVKTTTQELGRAHHIIESLDGATYAQDFQVRYGDTEALANSLSDIVSMPESVTTPMEIHKLACAMAQIATGENGRSIVITGNCSERVIDPVSAELPTQRALQELDVVAGSVPQGSILYIRRDRGQNTKPRSSEFETVDGISIPSYMGDAINSPETGLRTPDPVRLTKAALQAIVLERNLSMALGQHTPAAHEALNLYYEMPFVHQDSSGREYLLSADLPWIGVRTNGADSRHVDLLSRVENSVGVKLDANSSHDHLAQLSERLNPERKLGKIAWMLRVGLDNTRAMSEVIGSLADIEEAPIIMYDIHGSTIKREDGTKIRAVDDIMAEIEQLYDVCEQSGTRLRGVHLETTMEDRFECVASRDESPAHEGGIDPQLNARQTRQVLRHFAEIAA